MSASLPQAAASTGVSQRHSQLLLLSDDVLTSHLLPLVSNDAFYVLMPQLCTVTRRRLTQSHVHKQQAQCRMLLSDELWREMRRREWQMAADEWDVDDSNSDDEDIFRQYCGEEGDGDEKNYEDKEDEDDATADKSTMDVQRDWSIICTELHRRLTRLERLIFRRAPLNCYGERYQLPDAIRALLVDAWTVRLLTSHLPLRAQIRGTWRSQWVVKPKYQVHKLPPDCRHGAVVSASEVRHLPIVVSCTDCDEECDSPTELANGWQCVSIDCRPCAADGRQPAHLNDALIVAWQHDQYAYTDTDSRALRLRVYDSARQFLSDGGPHDLFDCGHTTDRAQEAVERLLAPSGGRSDDAAASDSEVDEEEEEEADEERMEAVREYLFAPWLRKSLKRKAKRAETATRKRAAL